MIDLGGYAEFLRKVRCFPPKNGGNRFRIQWIASPLGLYDLICALHRQLAHGVRLLVIENVVIDQSVGRSDRLSTSSRKDITMKFQAKCTVINQDDKTSYSEIPNDGDWCVVQVMRKIHADHRAIASPSRFERNEASPTYIPKTDWRTGSGRSGYGDR